MVNGTYVFTYGWQVGGRHPTGMLSCLGNICDDEADQSTLIKLRAKHYQQGFFSRW